MANRQFTQFGLTLEKQVVSLYAHVSFGATGAPTLAASPANNKGIVSVTRNSAGLYTFVFGARSANGNILDTYQKLLSISLVYDESGNSGTAPLAPLYYVVANSISVLGTSSIQIALNNLSQAATDPASGEACNIEFVFGNSTAT